MTGKDQIPPEVQQVVDAAVAEAKAKSSSPVKLPDQGKLAPPVKVSPETAARLGGLDPETVAPAREAAASKIIEEAAAPDYSSRPKPEPVPDIDLGHEATRIDQEAQAAKASQQDELAAPALSAWQRLTRWFRDQQGPSI